MAEVIDNQQKPGLGIKPLEKGHDKEAIMMIVREATKGVTDELKEVFRHRNILNLFNQVYGSPTNKNDNTGKVIEMMGLQKKCVRLCSYTQD